jgi:dihydroneopterin aldolase
VSTASAGASDDIRDTVDYAVVVERLRADLAGSISTCWKNWPSTSPPGCSRTSPRSWVRVSVAKLGMMPGVKRVGVIIERSI